MIDQRLIAELGDEKLYFIEEIDFAGSKKRMGRIVGRSGRKTIVDIDDALSRSNWQIVDQDWPN